MTRRRFAIASLAVAAHTAMNLALLATGAQDWRWMPVQLVATVVALAAMWPCGFRSSHVFT